MSWRLRSQSWEQTEPAPERFANHPRHNHPAAVDADGDLQAAPNTNCKQCGELTRYSFALKLSVSQKKLVDCPQLLEPQHTEKRIALEEIVIEAPAIG